MNAIFKKLNYKSQPEILVIHPPGSFTPNLQTMREYAKIETDISKVDFIEFVLSFVTEKEQIDALAPEIFGKIDGDALVWFAYPKKSSKKYTCNFNRDTGWEIMGQFGYEGVRMVAIDADWSALRFRNVQYIKKITRRKSMALTKEAKDRRTSCTRVYSST